MGRATCLLLAKEGQESANEIKKCGVAELPHLDTTKEQEVGEVFADIAKKLGRSMFLPTMQGLLE